MGLPKTKGGHEQAKKESAYPLYPLDEAIKIGDAVRDMGGSRTPVSKALLAKHMGYAETGPSFVQRIASAKTYGIIDGWGTYSLTDKGKRYFYPTTDSEKVSASLSFLSSPNAFRLLIDRFDGERLPNTDMIGNVLYQEANVPSSWKDRAAGLFIRGAQSVGIIDADGYLRYNANMQASQIAELPIDAKVVATSHGKAEVTNRNAISAIPQSSSQIDHQTVWTFRHKSGGYIRLETPEDMSKELWEKLSAYVQILEPSKDGTV